MSAVAEEREAAESQSIAQLNLVDAEHPWLGLDSFTEETRQFFHGRDEEVAELARRVQRKTLSILFGQSGLGKTSILRAGIVPRLRKEGFCPIYVRVDYSRESPAPSQQIKQAILKATDALGKWTKAGAAVPGESLWEFLHHRDDFLMDPRGQALIPLVIFDQFEEIFTLGQMDDFGRKRAEEFIADLADLVENRPPRAIELMMESEDSIVDRFDFDRADYRILIALREDYLAHLEALKSQMPSITQNRMRLARMTGHQALAAVTKPGGKLVSEEVAESIVRFVAGGAELRNAEVEPSLLSLVCRELNNTRIAQGRAEISADLLAGSRDTILNEFYERALSDQPAGVRRFVEDEMLTDSGFRESLAEERVQKGFAAANAMPNALSLLVNRRLLRIEERLDARRVELTHDVLCAVVKSSRDARREREAREEAERQLAEQRTREEATKRSLVRTRYVAIGAVVLAVGAIAGGVFGYYNMQRAREAEAQANATRGEAEKLVVFLIDDFYLELAPVGRLDTVAALAKRALDYYAGLPPAMRTPEADRNRALAQVRYGHALALLGRLDESEKQLADAIGVLKKLPKDGDASDLTAIGLGLGFAAKSRLALTQGSMAESLKPAEEGAALLTPLMSKPGASTRLKRAYGDVMTRLGFAQMRMGAEEDGVKSLRLARDAYRAIDDLKLTDLGAAAAYAEASAWLVEALASRTGRAEEAQPIAEEAARIASQVLERNPGHMSALRSHALLVAGLARIDIGKLRVRTGLEFLRQSEADYVALVRLDPGNGLAWNNLAGTRVEISGALEAQGRLKESLAVGRLAGETAAKQASMRANWANSAVSIAQFQAEMGMRRQDLVEYRKASEEGLKLFKGPSFDRDFMVETIANSERDIELAYGEYRSVVDLATKAIDRLKKMKAADEGEARSLAFGLAAAYRQVAIASYQLRDYAAAEAAMRSSIDHFKRLPLSTLGDKVVASEHQVILAQAIARQGRHEEASKIVGPELAFQRELMRRGSEDLRQHVILAEAMLVTALCKPAERAALLAEAAKILDSLPAEMRERRTVARIRAEIGEEAKRSL